MNTDKRKQLIEAARTVVDGIGVARGELIYVDGYVDLSALRGALRDSRSGIKTIGVSEAVQTALNTMFHPQGILDNDIVKLTPTKTVGHRRYERDLSSILTDGATLYHVEIFDEVAEPVQFYIVLGVNQGASKPRREVTRPPVREPVRGNTMVIKDKAVLEAGRDNHFEERPQRRPKNARSGHERRRDRKESKWQ